MENQNFTYFSLLKVIFRLNGIYMILTGLFSLLVATPDLINYWGSRDIIDSFVRRDFEDAITGIIDLILGIILFVFSAWVSGKVVVRTKEVSLDKSELPNIVEIFLKIVFIFFSFFLISTTLVMLLKILLYYWGEEGFIEEFLFLTVWIVPLVISLLLPKYSRKLAAIIYK